MSARRSEKMNATERRAKVAELHLKGFRNYQIVQELGLQRGSGDVTIHNDLNILREEWKKGALCDFNEAKQRQLEKLELLERELWLAWEKSKAPLVEHEIKSTSVRTDSGDMVDDEEVVTHNTAQRDGDVRITSQILDVIVKENELYGLGLNAKDGGSAPPVVSFNVVTPSGERKEVG